LEYAKKNFAELMPYVVKTCLYVTDLSQFKELNAVYVASFGLKPPARVCVEIPGDEVIAAFSFWNPEHGGEFAKIQENIHVQSVSKWAPPNIGPYSQLNKMRNLYFLAGNIGMYPPHLALINPEDIILQYHQIKHNFNQVLRLASNSPSLLLQQVSKSAIIYVNDIALLDDLMPLLQKDFGYLPEASLLVRISKLPMNSLIEMELVSDDSTVKTIENPQGLACRQKFYSADQLEAFDKETEVNTQGEVFYVHGKVDVASLRSNARFQGAVFVPVLELVNI